MRRFAITILAAAGLVQSAASSGHAQGYYPQAQPAYRPYTIPTQTPGYYPAQPGGFVTGNMSPYPGFAPQPQPFVPQTQPYDPNAVVNQQSSGSMYWDPYRGWVSHTNQTNVLNSALSPGRNTVMPGTSVQTYNYWNGTQWVRGTRWLGADGQWHGENTDTQIGPNGSTNTNKTVYAPNPNAGRP